MQVELQAAAPDAVSIIGVNGLGEESGTPLALAGRSLPYLQDTREARVWERWKAAWRDVVIVDRTGRARDVYNLFAHDLTRSTDYEELKALILSARQ